MHELSGCEEKCFDLCIDNKLAIEISGIQFTTVGRNTSMLDFISSENAWRKIKGLFDTFGRRISWLIFSQNPSELPNFVNSELKLVSEGFNYARIKEEIEGVDPSHWITILRHQ